MTFREEIEAAESAPKQIERLFQSALKEKREAEFRADLITCHRAAPDNLLYAAWFHRLRAAAADSTSARRKTNWKLALPLQPPTYQVYNHLLQNQR